MDSTPRFDLIVVGGGAAGLWTALVAADEGANVAVVSKTPLSGSASFWAQGGMAAALSPDDSVASHIEDTVNAGRDACRESAARVLCEKAPNIVEELERRGVPFDRDSDGNLALGLEGGHHHRRIVHAGGSETGRHLTATISELVYRHQRIAAFEGVSALALWRHEGRCIGVLTENDSFLSNATVLATGGAASIWERSTNPPGSSGSGHTLAYEAGAALADLEFVQFHPTALARPNGGKYDGFLITEAIRGEGARLLDKKGGRFVDELTPRDEIARSIMNRQRRDGTKSVDLDMRMVDPALFPNVAEVLVELGYDTKRDLIPVSPAVHYMMGGIETDLEGRTTIHSLYAVGECACTGLHGANRLASNSLSECFVFASRAARTATGEEALPRNLSKAPQLAALMPVSHQTRVSLWQFAGLERSEEGLGKLLSDPHPLARLVGRSALTRNESRGAHFRTDEPESNPEFDQRHVIVRSDEEVTVESWS